MMATPHATEIVYESGDLELFAHATRWKRYWSRKLRPFIKGAVIEVGAGIGTSTAHMCDAGCSSWLCLDPDPAHVEAIAGRVASGVLPKCCAARCGVLSDLPADLQADAIVYIDVLEHIEDDVAEMRTAAAHLRAGGFVVVLAPAFEFLYSPFDQAVGHFRRYQRKDAARLTPPSLELREVFHLDSVGFIASLGNRLLLRAAAPSLAQIKLWDRAMVPLSTVADAWFSRWFGRSIVMVWAKR